MGTESMSEGTGPANDTTRKRGTGAFMRGLRRATLLAAIVGGLGLIAGFLWFVSRVPREGSTMSRTAEGIVVLTGGASRIADAIELLASGRGQRLLITGVNPNTNSVELARLVPRYQPLFACCVDLDHAARNTIGNAIEARRWSRDRGFRSLLVVTSAYHMPRTMAEFAHQLPDVVLIGFPVISEKQRAASWWTPATARLLVSEYLKFLLAKLRMGIAPYGGRSPVDADETRG